MELTEAQLDRVVCPACLGALTLTPAHIRCQACLREYPIVDGLPVLIASRARLPSEPQPLG